MRRLEECIAEVKLWMANNFLKLNDEKTEFIVLGSKYDLAKLSEQVVNVGNETSNALHNCAEYRRDAGPDSHYDTSCE